MSLNRYERKRDFKVTAEPKGRSARRASGKGGIFVVQEHHARRLHFDLRLECEGVLKSWAVTREPSLNPSERRLAIQTEDHPMEYARFKGEIPKGEYGAGTVKIWDRGTFKSEKEVSEAMDRGLIEVTLRGRKLRGRFVLVRIQGEGEKSSWLFFKRRPKIVGLRIPTVKKAG